MTIVDAHLDLSYNALRGREVLRPAAEQTGDAEGIPTVGLPDLRAGGVGLVCATIFCAPATATQPGYRTPAEARTEAAKQLDWYQHQTGEGRFRFITEPRMLDDELPPVTPASENTLAETPPTPAAASPQNAILLLEGADALRTPDDVAPWFNAGLRIVGLAWKRTRYAGGTGEPGPLTPAGVEMVKALDRCHIIHDTSHLAEESFWHLLDLSPGPVMASHSNCRAIVPTDRQLSDDMIRALAKRGAVIGINFFDKFLLSPDEYGKRRATLADVARHARHICDLTGSAQHVGLGTDMDGGLGREQIPVEIRTSADLPRTGDALHDAGFNDEDIANILGGNWFRFFRQALPVARAFFTSS